MNKLTPEEAKKIISAYATWITTELLSWQGHPINLDDMGLATQSARNIIETGLKDNKKLPITRDQIIKLYLEMKK